MVNSKRTRKGLTLTELLIVVAIVVLLAGVTVPMMRPVLKGRNVREAARIVNVAFASAKARAVEKQRPAGIWLERAEHADPTLGYVDLDATKVPPTLTSNMYKVYKLYNAQQPPPYSGDSPVARARIITTFDSSFDLAGIPPVAIPPTPFFSTVVIPLQDAVSATLLNPGEKIQFNGRGGIHTIMSRPVPIANDVSLQKLPPFDLHSQLMMFAIRTLPDGIDTFPSAHLTNMSLKAIEKRRIDQLAIAKYLGRMQGQTVPFKVFRQPRKSTAAPIDMPNGTTIDLMLSGITSDNRTKFRYADGVSEVHPGQDIVIMFDPDEGMTVYYINSDFEYRESKYGQSGNAASSLFGRTQSREVTGDITLLIARDAQVGLNPNISVPIVSCESGAVSRSELPPESGANLADTSTIWMTITDSRVTNSPNLGFDPLDLNPLVPKTRDFFFDVHIRHARQLTRSGLSMGGE